MPVMTGFIHGTGAEINVEIGFVPDYVRISDWTNGNIITEGYMKRVVVFTSLSATIKPGYWIKGHHVRGQGEGQGGHHRQRHGCRW